MPVHGTWQVTGGGGGAGRGLLIVLGVLVLLGSGAAARLAETVAETLLVIVGMVALIVVTGAVWLVRYARRGNLVRAMTPPEWRPNPAAAPAPEKPQITPAQPPMIVNHYHGGTHLHIAAGTDPSAFIRKALEADVTDD